MRKVIQRRITKTVQPEIVEYYCDYCGKRCGTRDNPKETIYCVGGVTNHYCKRKCSEAR